jgi:LPXTG-motif cell wall-anchored protein
MGDDGTLVMALATIDIVAIVVLLWVLFKRKRGDL